MSDSVRLAQAESIRVRKERVHATMLIELLSLLIFLSMAFAFIQKEEALATPAQQQLGEARREIRELRAELRTLQARLIFLEEANRLLRSSIDGPLSPTDTRLALPEDFYEETADSIVNNQQLIDQLQRENESLRRRISGGGTDLPRCLVAPGFLYRIYVGANDTYQVEANWPDTAQGAVEQVPQAVAFGTGRSMSRTEFMRTAEAIQAWGRSQSPACGFTVEVFARHENLRLYVRQQQTIGRFFYGAYR